MMLTSIVYGLNALEVEISDHRLLCLEAFTTKRTAIGHSSIVYTLKYASMHSDMCRHCIASICVSVNCFTSRTRSH